MTRHLIGYARVSTDEQNLDLQIDALTAAGVAPGDVWTDKETGRHADRPGLQGALKAVRPGDVLVVWKLDRLGRSVLDILHIVSELREKGASFRSLTQAIDTSGPMGNLIVTVLGAVAELESSLISERTKAGMTAARRKGKHVGRPAKLTDQQLRMAETLLANPEHTSRMVADQLGVDRSTLYRNLSAYRKRTAKQHQKDKST